MWNNFIQQGKELAEKAKAAAIDLDKQLDESVGIETSNSSVKQPQEPAALNDFDNAFNDDAWGDDDQDLDTALDAPSSEEKTQEPGLSTETPDLQGETLSTIPEPTTVSPPVPAASDTKQSVLTDQQQQGISNEDEEDQAVSVVAESQEGSENSGMQDLATQHVAVEPAPEEEEPLQQQSPAVDDTSTSVESASTQNAVSDGADEAMGMGTETHLDDTDRTSQSHHMESSTGEPGDHIEPSPTAELKDASGQPEDVASDRPTVEVGTSSSGAAWTQDDADIAFTETDRDEEDMPIASPKEPLDVSATEQEQLDPVVDRTVIQSTGDSDHDASSPAAELASDTIPPDSDAKDGPIESTTALNSKLNEQLQSQQEITRALEERVAQLQVQVQQREEQLFSKTQQLTSIQAIFESEKDELKAKIERTKEEAKKRIQKAKDRVETMEARLKAATASQGSSADDADKQAEIIAALRAEGESLARRQADMEKATRAAKGEARELREKLEDEVIAKEDALDRIDALGSELKETKASLSLARMGESQIGKLESDMLLAREENERKGSSILSLEQQVKELKEKIRDLVEELEQSKEGAAVETKREQQKLRKEQNEMLTDLDGKLRTVEREAAVREDALRREVDELRKRWQDAVRRADALSMDIQSSTAPLLRQLESSERQSRARAAAAAEVETKLRSELEDTVISNEKLTKERSEWKTKFTRLERKAKEEQEELKSTNSALGEKTAKVQQLEEKLEKMETEGAKMKEEWAEVERLANEGVARVRSEMTQTVVESEERYRSQIDSMKGDLTREQEKRRQLERQVEKLIENAGMIVPPTARQSVVKEAKPKRLRSSEGQAEILAGALGLGDEEDDDTDEEDAGDPGGGTGSFAALEEFSSRLKSAKVEVNALRKSLADSEKTRKELAEALGEARHAKEKLPLFEEKVKQLTVENEQQAMEIQAQQEDIAEVRHLYRSQLNVLLEEKTMAEKRASMNGDSDLLEASDDPVPNESEE